MSASCGPPTANWRLAFELASLIQHDPKIGSDPVLLGELTDLLSHELDKPDEDPKLTQYVALTLGAFQTLEARTESGQSVNPLVPLARALDPKYETKIRIAAAASLAKQAARMNGQLDDARRDQGPGRGRHDRRARSAPDGRLCPGVFRRPVGHGDSCASGSRRTRTVSSATTPPWRSPAAAIRPPQATLREMLSTADLNKVIELPGDTEKQNKIEAIELEALEALRTSISNGSAGAGQVASPSDQPT